ncbi:MAG: ABC transporter ATP-binding protein [Sedimentibacter sp.]
MKEVIIKATDLCKNFKTGSTFQKVLKNINVEIYKGDFTVIMGSSGSGKSTLLYALSYMDKPTHGTIELAGKQVKYRDKELAKVHSSEISFVFQNSNLLPDLTGFENIAYPAYMVDSKQSANKDTEEILKKFDIESIRDKYPNEMSGGQQQRVAVARALIRNPNIVFADEPTGALNSSAGVQVLDLLTQINTSGQSIVMVTHDIKACARGNRLIFLSDGQIGTELDLGKYTSDKQHEREETIFKFLKKNNW